MMLFRTCWGGCRAPVFEFAFWARDDHRLIERFRPMLGDGPGVRSESVGLEVLVWPYDDLSVDGCLPAGLLCAEHQAYEGSGGVLSETRTPLGWVCRARSLKFH